MTETAIASRAPDETGQRGRRSLGWHARRHPTVTLGLALLTIVIVGTLLAPWLTQHDPLFINPLGRLRPPSAAHPFGTDGHRP
jgi:peptide/nickel transport system permease protein